jgi:hypothetical protein
MVLGEFDGGRGAEDTVFWFTVEQAGVYFFRLLWFEGTGDASVEWFTLNEDGSAALVGGSNPGRSRPIAPVPSRNRTTQPWKSLWM